MNEPAIEEEDKPEDLIFAEQLIKENLQSIMKYLLPKADFYKKLEISCINLMPNGIKKE
ncbi:MAG: hypothetical protein JSV62_00735 [Promethearchaeota archaeon]|nr:MAG: hypothetical protein JSV62_00735 [Candidatus Lokiarchaeota archaeon]